jgi:hypothetical protein
VWARIYRLWSFPPCKSDYQEINKVVPQILRYFDMRLAYPERDWKLITMWFCVQKDIRVIFTQRKKVELYNI